MKGSGRTAAFLYGFSPGGGFDVADHIEGAVGQHHALRSGQLLGQRHAGLHGLGGLDRLAIAAQVGGQVLGLQGPGVGAASR